MVWHFYGKTKTAIISSNNQFRPPILSTDCSSRRDASVQPSFRSWQFFFGQSYEENQVQKIRHGIYHTILKTAKSTFVPGFPILPEPTINLEVTALFAWAPQANSGFYIVKSAMRLINSALGTALCSLSLRAVGRPSRVRSQIALFCVLKHLFCVLKHLLVPYASNPGRISPARPYAPNSPFGPRVTFANISIRKFDSPRLP
jgi:hypothetical protein